MRRCRSDLYVFRGVFDLDDDSLLRWLGLADGVCMAWPCAVRTGVDVAAAPTKFSRFVPFVSRWPFSYFP